MRSLAAFADVQRREREPELTTAGLSWKPRAAGGMLNCQSENGLISQDTLERWGRKEKDVICSS